MLSEIIARYVTDTNYPDLPLHVQKKVKECFIDWLGCCFAGATLEPVHSLMQVFTEENKTGKSRVIGTSAYLDSLSAALVNGTSAHSMEMDDIYKYGLYHPAAPVISAAFAVAESIRASGAELLAGIVVGYEISNRIAAAVNPSHYKYWHTTGTVGTFGAAVAACKILKASNEQIVWALGNAGTQAAGLWECTGTMAKPFHAGKAAFNGLLAALSAKKGLTGPRKILEGDAGFFKAMSQFSGDIYEIFADLGQKYTILDNTFKAYPSCGHTHAPIDAALAIINKNDLDLSKVQEIKVSTYRSGIKVAGIDAPKDPVEAKFSIAYCVACALQNKGVTLNDFNWPPPKPLLDLMTKVSLEIDPECEQAFPGKRGARVKITTEKDTYVEFKSCRKGDPENPLTQDELWVKFTSLAAMILNTNQITELKGVLERLEEVTNLGEIKVCRG
jgi:2-methylcitrate dehydratase PrpD